MTCTITRVFLILIDHHKNQGYMFNSKSQ